ncbi:MAG: DUF6508 domain-containing protein, partial [Myxococcota bacterium]|nr:DUF6508 domain-containing protein [Myxococcota bacterium]
MSRAVSVAALDEVAACLEGLERAQSHGTLYETTGEAFAPYVYCAGVRQLIDAFSRAIHLEGFDWAAWHADEGAQWFEAPERIPKADLVTLSRILVTIVRSEHFA